MSVAIGNQSNKSRTMSSRSTSPTPSSKGGGSESGGVASLSNDALYTPLSSLHADNNHPSNNSNQTQSKKKSRHSLSLQTSASLRESSLVTFLTSMGNNLKTSHPQECHVYRGLGGSIGRYGTGDGGRVDKAMRSTMENKLSNRSLVLVGGGIHSYTPATTSSGGDAKSGGMARSSKRIRKRVGGNGVFGCKSHRQRKKAMKKVMEETQSSESATNPTAEELDEKVGNIVETLHQMWINYIQQILSPLKKKSRAAAASISLEARKEIATILTTSEHVGMTATIVACPSRRHLGSKRCIVLEETKETFKIAIMKSRPAQAQKKVTETNAGSGAKSAKPYLWKVVMIPKHGTSLDVSVPWSSGRDRIIVRLET
mmetsp:Transcript_13814/g.23468  ORF Transcript_13814/g.23468 Transcript_13814/m.23468 type:complete len:371 (+) Transcript_13814:8-1120(+)